MYSEIKKQTPNSILLIGLIIYIYILLQSTFSFSILWSILILYSWVFTSIYFKQLTFDKIKLVFCFFGIILSITLFFLYGVEKLPYPEGAIMFHVNKITISLVLFFISSLPLILMNKNNFLNEVISFFSHNNIKDPGENNTQKEKWEEATLEDVNSGDFEVF